MFSTLPPEAHVNGNARHPVLTQLLGAGSIARPAPATSPRLRRSPRFVLPCRSLAEAS